MNRIKFNAASQAEELTFSAFWDKSQCQDHQRLYTLQSRLAVLRIRRRIRGIRDRAQTRALLHMCRLARATLRHASATVHTWTQRAKVGGRV